MNLDNPAVFHQYAVTVPFLKGLVGELVEGRPLASLPLLFWRDSAKLPGIWLLLEAGIRPSMLHGGDSSSLHGCCQWTRSPMEVRQPS